MGFLGVTVRATSALANPARRLPRRGRPCPGWTRQARDRRGRGRRASWWGSPASRGAVRALRRGPPARPGSSGGEPHRPRRISAPPEFGHPRAPVRRAAGRQALLLDPRGPVPGLAGRPHPGGPLLGLRGRPDLALLARHRPPGGRRLPRSAAGDRGSHAPGRLGAGPGRSGRDAGRLGLRGIVARPRPRRRPGAAPPRSHRLPASGHRRARSRWRPRRTSWPSAAG